LIPEDWKHILRLGGIGILNPADLPGLDSQKGRVLRLMLDRDWHDAPEILSISGGMEGLRRLRELRDLPKVTVERKRMTGNRLFKYRLRLNPDAEQQDLFGA